MKCPNMIVKNAKELSRELSYEEDKILIIKEAISDKAKRNMRIGGGVLLGAGAIGAGIKFGPRALKHFKGRKIPAAGSVRESIHNVGIGKNLKDVGIDSKIEDIINFRKRKGLFTNVAGDKLTTEGGIREVLKGYSPKNLSLAHDGIQSPSIWDIVPDAIS